MLDKKLNFAGGLPTMYGASLMTRKEKPTEPAVVDARLGKGPNGPEGARLGYTKEGKPRERAYRTYFGVTQANQVVRYPSYEAREIDVKEGKVRRITRGEASRIDAESRYPSPLIHSTQWSLAGVGSPQPSVNNPPVAFPQETKAQTEIPKSKRARYADRRIIEARALLSATKRTLEELQSRLDSLESQEDEDQ